jgi:hypothetical protein
MRGLCVARARPPRLRRTPGARSAHIGDARWRSRALHRYARGRRTRRSGARRSRAAPPGNVRPASPPRRADGPVRAAAMAGDPSHTRTLANAWYGDPAQPLPPPNRSDRVPGELSSARPMGWRYRQRRDGHREHLAGSGREAPLPPDLRCGGDRASARHADERFGVKTQLPRLPLGIEQPIRLLDDVGAQTGGDLAPCGLVSGVECGDDRVEQRGATFRP